MRHGLIIRCWQKFYAPQSMTEKLLAPRLLGKEGIKFILVLHTCQGIRFFDKGKIVGFKVKEPDTRCLPCWREVWRGRCFDRWAPFQWRPKFLGCSGEPRSRARAAFSCSCRAAKKSESLEAQENIFTILTGWVSETGCHERPNLT